MFRVFDFMTKNPVTVDPSEKISAVIDLMRYHKIHRIPVVDADDRLCGLITEGMIAADNSATSLSIYELNYLLSKTEVRTVMLKRPVAVNQNALMEDATEKLLTHDIGCLPVVDDAGKVTGILTQNDIFKCFLEMLGWKEKGGRIIVEVKERIGALEDLSAEFARASLSIRSLSVYSFRDNEARILIRTSSAIPQAFVDTLEKDGYKVFEVDNI